MKRRGLLLAPLLLPGFARAQSWPDKPLRVIVPYAPGGSSDVLARLLQPGLQQLLGQPIVIDNRPGAGSMLGTEAAARSAPDGFSFLLADMPHTIVPAVQQRLPYDPVADFAPVTVLGVAAFLLFAHPSVPAADAVQLAALARAQPDRLAFSSGGNGSASHLMGELFQREAGVRLTHVPYRGAGPAMQDLAAGQVQLSFTTLATAAPLLQSGQVKALGAMSAARLPTLPGVATMQEQGLPLVVEHWWGLLAPARTPEAVVQRFAAVLAELLRQPDLAPRLAQLGVTPQAEGPAAFATRITTDLARWQRVVRDAGITLQ